MPRLVMSKRFRFVEYTWYTMPTNDQATWRPVASPLGRGRVRDKWIYVFRTSTPLYPSNTPPAPTVLHRACFADSVGNLSVAPGAVLRQAGKQRIDWARYKTHDVCLSLEDYVEPTTQFLYYFFVSRIEVNLAFIDNLEASIASIMPAVNLPDEVGDTAVDPAIVYALDPISVAENLHQEYLRRADLVAVRTFPGTDMNEYDRAETTARLEKAALASMIKSVVDGDPDNNLKIHNKNSVKVKVNRYLESGQDALEKLRQAREEAKKWLIWWTNGWAWNWTHETYVQRHPDFDDLWLEVLAGILARAIESERGKAELKSLIANRSFYIAKYVLPQSNLSDLEFQVSRKAGTAIIAIFKDLVPFLVHVKDPVDLALYLSRISRARLLKVETRRIQFPHRKLSVSRSTLRVVDAKIVRLTESAAVGYLTEFWFNQSKKFGVALGTFVEAMNLALDVKTMLDAFESPGATYADKGFAIANAVGSVADTVEGLNVLLGSSPKSIAKWAFVGAVIDAVCATKDISDAWAVGNTGVVVGQSAILAGSGMIAWATWPAILGRGAMSGWIGFTGALVVLLGNYLNAVFSDTDIEVFIEHSIFGARRDPLGAPTDHLQPAWSPTNVDEWTDNPPGVQKQLAALFNLVYAFSIQATGPRRIRIHIVDFSIVSRVAIKMTGKYAGGPDLVADCVVDLAGNFTDKNPRYQCRVQAAIGTDSNQKPFIDFEMYWAPNLPPNVTPAGEPELQRCDVEVQLHIDGSGRALVPNTAPLAARVYDRYYGVAQTPAYSTSKP